MDNSEWVVFGMPWDSSFAWGRDDYEELYVGKCFCNLGLNKPGTLVEVDGKVYLIGDINTEAGVCDDCVAFDGAAIVTRYRVIWQE